VQTADRRPLTAERILFSFFYFLVSAREAPWNLKEGPRGPEMTSGRSETLTRDNSSSHANSKEMVNFKESRLFAES